MNWTQLRTLLWLRFRLTWNQISRTGHLNAVLTLIVGIIGIALGVLGSFAGILAGAFALAPATPLVYMLAWDGLFAGFMFFWLIAIMAELQRSEMLDLTRLLHLPVSLEGIFVMNYLSSHLSFSVFFF